jgi:hypothetical protein
MVLAFATIHNLLAINHVIDKSAGGGSLHDYKKKLTQGALTMAAMVATTSTP